MAFILDAQADSPEELTAIWRRYREYVAANQARFPIGGYGLAMADWYYNHEDPRCPHDGWLESAALEEPATGERHEVRTVSLRVRLLGAYHDGHIEFRYPTVFRYEITGRDVTNGHGDWLYDEFRISDSGRLLHEIEWAAGSLREGRSRWLIEASDVEYAWLPFRR